LTSHWLSIRVVISGLLATVEAYVEVLYHLDIDLVCRGVIMLMLGRTFF